MCIFAQNGNMILFFTSESVFCTFLPFSGMMSELRRKRGANLNEEKGKTEDWY